MARLISLIQELLESTLQNTGENEIKNQNVSETLSLLNPINLKEEEKNKDLQLFDSKIIKKLILY